MDTTKVHLENRDYLLKRHSGLSVEKALDINCEPFIKNEIIKKINSKSAKSYYVLDIMNMEEVVLATLIVITSEKNNKNPYELYRVDGIDDPITSIFREYSRIMGDNIRKGLSTSKKRTTLWKRKASDENGTE